MGYRSRIDPGDALADKEYEEQLKVDSTPNKVCSWCQEEITSDQPTSKCCDGEVMHFGCAAQADDGDDMIG